MSKMKKVREINLYKRLIYEISLLKQETQIIKNT